MSGQAEEITAQTPAANDQTEASEGEEEMEEMASRVRDRVKSVEAPAEYTDRLTQPRPDSPFLPFPRVLSKLKLSPLASTPHF
jgi:hypothetical protein